MNSQNANATKLLAVVTEPVKQVNPVKPVYSTKHMKPVKSISKKEQHHKQNESD